MKGVSKVRRKIENLDFMVGVIVNNDVTCMDYWISEHEIRKEKSLLSALCKNKDIHIGSFTKMLKTCYGAKLSPYEVFIQISRYLQISR